MPRPVEPSTGPAQRGAGRYPQYTAFGEAKTLHAWAKDPRCVVAYDTLHDRIHRAGMDIEAALTTVPRRPVSGPTPSSVHPIVARLRERRLALDLTVPQVAERLGWKMDRLLSYELGRSRIRLEDAIEWAEAIGMRIELTGPEEPGDDED